MPEEFTGTYSSSFFPENVEYIDTCWDVEPLDTAGEFPGTGDDPAEAEATMIDRVPSISNINRNLFNYIAPEFLLHMPDPDLPFPDLPAGFYL